MVKHLSGVVKYVCDCNSRQTCRLSGDEFQLQAPLAQRSMRSPAAGLTELVRLWRGRAPEGHSVARQSQ